jgi:hypothetical protein
MARSFGDVMRDIGRAFGFGGGGGGGERTGPGANRGSLGSLVSGPSTGSLGLPFGNSRPSAVTARGDRDRGDRDRDGPATPVVPVAPPTPEVTPEIPPVTPAPEVPQAPRPVNPSDMTSTGPVEDAAIESVQGGRASTILTSPMGLLPEEEQEGLLRDRRRLGRSLMGGGLIK